jgi:hypothetical protein
MMSEPETITCHWCGKPFVPKSRGGAEQKYDSADCRKAFHRAARLYTADMVDQGFLTTAVLRSKYPDD